jgi:hypothetical protein
MAESAVAGPGRKFDFGHQGRRDPTDRAIGRIPRDL